MDSDVYVVGGKGSGCLDCDAEGLNQTMMDVRVKKRWRSAGFVMVLGLLVSGTGGAQAEDPPVAPKASGKSEAFRYDAQDRRDPFVPLVRDGRLVGMTGVRTESSKPILYGVLWDPGGSSIALINDGEVRVGDTIGAYQVVEIQKDSVVLSDGADLVVLQISFDAPPTGRHPKGTTEGGEGS